MAEPDGDPGRLLSRFEDGFPRYFLENRDLYTYEHPRIGTLKAVGPVAYFSKTGSVLQGPAPEEPGQHTQAILVNAGFTSAREQWYEGHADRRCR